jgi:hypothetical protein
LLHDAGITILVPYASPHHGGVLVNDLSLAETIGKVQSYRTVRNIQDGLGTAGQVAWTKVGWTGDFSLANGTERNDLSPNSRKYPSYFSLSFEIRPNRSNGIPLLGVRFTASTFENYGKFK